MTTPIPQPRAIPFIGNVASLDREVPLRTWTLLADKYGEIYQLNMLGKIVVFTSTYALLNELSDEKRFTKSHSTALYQVRNLAKDGLFTAFSDELNWGIAHRLLMPAFGPVAIREMMEDMTDISNQLLLKWDRFGPESSIDAAGDFTRLTLDTIALCSMSYRMNSFYTDGQPTFAKAMVDFLTECYARSNRPAVVQHFMHGASTKYEEDMKVMIDIAEKIVAERKKHPSDKKDLLNTMLHGKDPKTGQGLSDDSIVKNLITFLIAGHETTSGTLSFATYYLLKNPDAMRKLRAEVDEVIGNRPARIEDFSKMPYLNAVLRETLRLQATAPVRSVTPLEDTTLGGGKYAVKAGQVCVILTHVTQKDPLVWGEDAKEFRPERMMDGKFEALPPNAWQPFGYGMRGCIGRPFAWQEMQLVLSSVLQKFELSFVDPSYTLEIKQSLTIKPANLFIRATPRANGHIYASPSSGLKADFSGVQSVAAPTPTSTVADESKKPLYVLYGSNTGTSESFAQRIASDAPSHGFSASIGTLDSATEHLPTDGPVVIVTASFEGQPADNAARFVNWLVNLEGDKLAGVRFGVFGCGHHDWAQTYQRIPTLCDELLEKHGGERLVSRGAGDAGEGNFFQVFDEFEVNLWDVLCKEYQTSRSKSVAGFEVKTVDPGTTRASALRQPDAELGRVVENRVLTKPGAAVKRHIEFELPKGMTAHAGDYLAIIPHNPSRDVHRVLARFDLSYDDEIILTSSSPTSLPVNRPVSVSTLLGGYVELSQPATTRDLRTLSEAAESKTTQGVLNDLSASYTDNVLANRLSVLDILEKHPDIKLSFGTFLSLLPSMRVRQYSISSSPLWNPEHVTLTISVIEGPSDVSDQKTEPFLGVASTYLAHLRPGDKVHMSVRPSSVSFHPPVDLTTPVVMFCAGSGFAPMRGFIQERALQKQSGREVAKMLLFFGCRSPEEDYLYADGDLKEWVELGVLDARPAFSRKTEESCGCKYVQDRIWHDREDVRKAYHNNAKFFTCGSGKVATGIKAKLIEIVKIANNLSSDEEALEKFEKVTTGRYATDVFD